MAKKKSKEAESVDPGSVSDILNSIQNRFGNELVRTLSGGQVTVDHGFSWGVPSVNYICTENPFYGIPLGRIIELFGMESSGKTTLALHAVANTQKQGFIVGYIDAEHAVDLNYAVTLGVQPDKLIFSQPDYGEQALTILSDMIKKGVRLIIVDSAVALTPLAEIEGGMEKIQVGAQARMLGKALRTLIAEAGRHKASIIFINQIRMKIGVMFGSPETTPCGLALKFASTIRLKTHLSTAKAKAIKGATGTLMGSEEEARLGSIATVRCIKNKVASPFREREIPFYYNRGFDAVMDLYNIGVKFGVIEKGRGNFKVAGKNVKYDSLESEADVVVGLLKKKLKE